MGNLRSVLIFVLVDGDPFGMHICQQYQLAMEQATGSQGEQTQDQGTLWLLGLRHGDLERRVLCGP